MQLPDFHRTPNISPAWWGAIASGAAAGAILFPDARVVGGTIAGAALYLLALTKTPCCSACAGATATAAASSPPLIAARVAPSPSIDLGTLTTAGEPYGNACGL